MYVLVLIADPVFNLETLLTCMQRLGRMGGWADGGYPYTLCISQC